MRYTIYIFITLTIIVVSCTSEKKKVHRKENPNQSIAKIEDKNNAIKIDEASVDTPFVFDVYYELLRKRNTDSINSMIDKYGVELKDFKGRTFYSLCLSYSNLKCINHLIEHKYKLNEKEIYETARIFKNDTLLISKIISSDKKNIFKKLFKIAILNCDLPLIEYLLKRNYKFSSIVYEDMGGVEQENHTICFINTCENSTEILNLLLSNTFKIYQEDYECLLLNNIDEGIPIFADKVFLKELINKGNFKESSNWSPLISSTYWNVNDIVIFLLKNGYSPNWNNTSNLLFYAYSRPGDGFGEHITDEVRLRTVELLLQFDANPYLKIINSYYDTNGLTFNQYAIETRNKQLLKLLEKYKR